MKIEEVYPQDQLKHLPVQFQFLKPLKRRESAFIDHFAGISRYQSLKCNVYPPLKPISKMF